MKNVLTYEQLNNKLNEGYNALHSAASKGIPSIIRNLVKSIDVNSVDDNHDKKTPLIYACEYEKLPAVIALIKAGANINKGDNSNCTPLYYACKTGNYDIVKFLIDNGADAHINGSSSWDHIMTAAFIGDNTDIVKLLFSLKVPIPNTSLDYAIHVDDEKNTKMLEFLIENGIDITKAENLDYHLNRDDKKQKYREIFKSIDIQEKMIKYNPNMVSWLVTKDLLNPAIAKKYPHILTGADLGLFSD